MVFAVRCPAEKCRKYMLVEDHHRGQIVSCLICKTQISIPAATETKTVAATSTTAPQPFPEIDLSP